jgi:spermidine synthase
MELWFTEKYGDKVGFSLKVKETLFAGESPYQTVHVLDTHMFGKVLTLDGLFMTTDRDEFIYHEMITHPVMYLHDNPQDILVIGGGDGGTVREILKHSCVNKVVLCEIDDMVIEVSKKFLPEIAVELINKNPKLEVFVGDGIKYVEDSKGIFDILIVDSTDPIGPAVGLFSVEFYQNCKRALKNDGIFVAQSESPFYDINIIKSIKLNLHDAGFKFVRFYYSYIPTYPSACWSWVMASDKYDPINDFPEVKEFNIRTKYFYPELGRASFVLPLFFKKEIED